MKVRLELGSLWIIEHEQKAVLECYVDQRLFIQRKSYAEYYLDITNYDADVDIRDLMILAENFKVQVLHDSVIIS